MDLGATLQRWRERGRHRFDPVRFRLIEALARRAAACGGAARALVEDRVAGLLAVYGEDLANARWDAAEPDGPPPAWPPASPSGRPTGRLATPDRASAAAAAATARREDRPRRGALADLVEYIARHAPPRADGGVADASATHQGAPAELGTLGYFRRTWAKLSAERRVTQSLAKLPGNAGPLNSQRLVHQSLMRMRELSPEYLRHFTTHVDALLWLEELQGARSGAAGKAAPPAVR